MDLLALKRQLLLLKHNGRNGLKIKKNMFVIDTGYPTNLSVLARGISELDRMKL